MRENQLAEETEKAIQWQSLIVEKEHRLYMKHMIALL
jgi:hypothetical protein